MFESAEIGHAVDKDTYDAEVPALREALLKVQYELHQQRRFPVIVLINKIDLAASVGRQNSSGNDQASTLSFPPSQESLFSSDWPEISISALKQQNLEAISTLIWKQLGLDGFDYRKPTVFSKTIASELDAYGGSPFDKLRDRSYK